MSAATSGTAPGLIDRGPACLRSCGIRTRMRSLLHLSPRALGYLHMCDSPCSRKALEVRQAIVECNRPWWFVRSISAPAAKFGDDPGRPSESIAGMRIFLKLGLALKGLVEGLDDLDLLAGEDKVCRKRIAPTTDRKSTRLNS